MPSKPAKSQTTGAKSPVKSSGKSASKSSATSAGKSSARSQANGAAKRPVKKPQIKTSSSKLPAILAAALALIFVAVIVIVKNSAEDTVASPAQLVPADAHIVGVQGTSSVTVVEFLDFECPACAAAYPMVEQVREKYSGQVTFVARHFPLPMHYNAERASRSVEAASRQGKFLEMYQLMYETQADWGGQRTPIDDTFRGMAEQIGLDMTQYDADYDSEEVAAVVERDMEDGADLGVMGTPTFYVNGEVYNPTSAEAFDAYLAGLLEE